jgi:hypothetical protein
MIHVEIVGSLVAFQRMGTGMSAVVTNGCVQDVYALEYSETRLRFNSLNSTILLHLELDFWASINFECVHTHGDHDLC